MRRVLALAVTIAAAFPAASAAQPAVRNEAPVGRQPSGVAPLAVTLDDAIGRGLAASHRLAEAAARGEAATAIVDERRAAALPVVSAQGGYTRTNHVDQFGILLPNNQLNVIYPDLANNYRTRLDVVWPVFTAGRLDALERAARAEAGASADDLAAARADLRLDIAREYWRLVTSIEALRVVNESVARVQAHLRDVRNQFDAGLVPPNDVSSVEAQESHERMLSVQARTARDVAEAQLARLIGVVPGTPIQPASGLEAPAVSFVPDARVSSADPIPALVDEARAHRPERAGLMKRVSAADERLHAATAGNKPTVGIGGGVDYARPNPRIFPRADLWRQSWDASINVNWAVFDGGKTRSEAAEASAMKRAAEERLADFDSILAVEVHQRFRELESSRAAIAAADAAVRSASEARRVVGDRFSAGVATSTDVRDAQVVLLQAELDRTQAIANARLAEAALARAVGR